MELSLADLRTLICPEASTASSPTTPNVGLSELIGKAVFIRTVTHHHTGRLVSVDLGCGVLVLDDAAWIADDGRFSMALKTGTLNEVEPFPGRCYVAIGSLIDACEWEHDLPRVQK